MWRYLVALCIVFVPTGSAAAQRVPSPTWEQVRKNIPAGLPEAQRKLLIAAFMEEQHVARDLGLDLRARGIDGDTADMARYLIKVVSDDPGWWWRWQEMRVVRHIIDNVPSGTPASTAARMLFWLPDSGLPEIIEALKHKSMPTRRAAAYLLKRPPPESAILPLIDLVDDPEATVRAAAIVCLGYRKNNRAIRPIFKRLKDVSPVVRIAAVRTAGALGQNDVVLENGVVERLGDPDPRVRNAAIWALGQMKATSRAGSILRFLRDEDKMTRHRAIESVGKLGNYVATPHLLALLADKDQTEHDHYKVVTALGEIGDPRATMPLIERLKSGDKLTPHVALALGKIRDRRATRPLIAAARDDRYSVRQMAAIALGQIGDPAATETLIAMLDDKRNSAVEAAITSLGAMNDPRAIDPLIKLLYAPPVFGSDREIRAHNALAQIRHPDVVRRLIDSMSALKLDHTNRSNVNNVAHLLNQITGEQFLFSGPRTIERWVEWLKQPKSIGTE